MAKNKKTMKTDRPGPPAPIEPLSSRGKTMIATGGILVVCGFVVLSFADPLGRNLAAQVSPFLLIFGYAVVGFGLFLPPPSPAN